jgi:peptide/nickel transport system permease protein
MFWPIHGCEPDRMDAATHAALQLAATRAERTESPAARAVRNLGKRKAAIFGLVLIALFIVLALLAPIVAPYDPTAQSWTSVRKAPSLAHWFGTDDVGRDVLTRVIYGARASLMAGCISIAIALAIGVPLGMVAGYLGGFLDAVLSRITDAMLAIPFLILAIALAAFLGPSLGNAMIAIGVTTTPIFVRLTRAQVMAVKVEDYIEAARAVGNPRWRIALVHILPNILPALLVQATLSIAAAIAQPIAQEIERQNGQEDRNSRPDRHPGRAHQKALRGIEHAAPGRRRGLLAEAEE